MGNEFVGESFGEPICGGEGGEPIFGGEGGDGFWLLAVLISATMVRSDVVYGLTMTYYESIPLGTILVRLNVGYPMKSTELTFARGECTLSRGSRT